MDTFDKIMENSDDMITLQTDDGETVSFYVLEETKMNGETYLLVSDSKEEDGDCYLCGINQNRKTRKHLMNLWTMTVSLIICPKFLKSL